MSNIPWSTWSKAFEKSNATSATPRELDLSRFLAAKSVISTSIDVEDSFGLYANCWSSTHFNSSGFIENNTSFSGNFSKVRSNETGLNWSILSCAVLGLGTTSAIFIKVGTVHSFTDCLKIRDTGAAKMPANSLYQKAGMSSDGALLFLFRKYTLLYTMSSWKAQSRDDGAIWVHYCTADT